MRGILEEEDQHIQSVCQVHLPLCVGGAGGSGVGSSRDSTERAMLFGLEWRELMGELEGSDITSRESPPLTVWQRSSKA